MAKLKIPQAPVATTHQVAALPMRTAARTGRIKVLLVTTLDTGRWVIPKGWPWPDRPDHAAAAEEAWEEAGVIGNVTRKRLGSYSYLKRRKHGAAVHVRVDVYPFEVTEQKRTWPEHKHRQRKWLSPAKAAERVEEPELKAMIAALNSID